MGTIVNDTDSTESKSNKLTSSNNDKSKGIEDLYTDKIRDGQWFWNTNAEQIFSEDSTIVAVGHASAKSIVPLELLRYIYLQPHDRIYDPNTHTISYLQTRTYLPVKSLPPKEKKRILVTGGAGFVGSHLVDRLMLMGH